MSLSTRIVVERMSDEKYQLLQDHPAPSVQQDPLAIKLKALKNEFDELCQTSNDKQKWTALSEANKLAIEKRKYAIMQSVNSDIELHYGKFKSKLIVSPHKKTMTAIWKSILFGFLIIVDIVITPMTGFWGSVELLQIITGISQVSASITAAVMATIDSTMLFSIFKPFLQRALGISPEQPPGMLVENYLERCYLIENMNKKMVNNFHYNGEQSSELYQQFAPILKSFNQDMRKTKILPYQESKTKKFARYGLTTLNTLFSIAGTYFSAVLFLTAVGAALIGTPAGWGIIGVIIVAQLVTKFLIRQNAIYDLFNPSASQHEAAREKLEQFEDKSDGIDRDLKTMQQLTKVKRMDVRENLLRPNQVKPKQIAECPSFFKPGQVLSAQVVDDRKRMIEQSILLREKILRNL